MFLKPSFENSQKAHTLFNKHNPLLYFCFRLIFFLYYSNLYNIFLIMIWLSISGCTSEKRQDVWFVAGEARTHTAIQVKRD